MVDNSTKEAKPGKPLKYNWPEMEVGGTIETDQPLAHAGNQWAERNGLDRRFSNRKLGVRKYEIKRVK